MRGQLRIPVESVKEAIRNWIPTAEFDEKEPLDIIRTSLTYMYTKRPLPGDKFTDAALTYDANSEQFAASVPDFAVWTGFLPKYKVPVIGSLCMSYTVDPEEFPCLKERALSGRPLVLRPEDHVRLSDRLVVMFADHARGPEDLEDQLAIGDASAWDSSTRKSSMRGSRTGR